MSIVSDILAARDQLMSTFKWNDSFAYVIPSDRVREVAEDVWRYHHFPPTVNEIDAIEHAIRAGEFKIGDIPLIVQYDLKSG